MNISFKLLEKQDFPLLLDWLNQPHVNRWWDTGQHWTPTLIQEKYHTYVQGYKIENDVSKPIQAYIISIDQHPAGYLQIYNPYDFLEFKKFEGLPDKLVALDIFIGDKFYLNQGIASQAIIQFFDHYPESETIHIFVSPTIENLAARRAYEKAGFFPSQIQNEPGKIWLLKPMSNAKKNTLITTMNHVTLAVKDIERSFHFYHELLGFKPLVKWDKGAYFLLGPPNEELWFCLNIDQKREVNACYTHYAFSVRKEDFSIISEKIVSAGAKIFKENTSPGESLYFLDPDGHKLEIHVGSWIQRINAKKVDRGNWKNVTWFV